MSERDWVEALPIGDLVQREPHEGQAATERTEVKLLYDSSNLYIGVLCHDSEPARVIGAHMARDADLTADDRIEILIDTFHDRRNAYYFATNPAGALVDGIVIENRKLNTLWDCVWHVQTRRLEDGWSAEFSIPFKSLNFSGIGNSWGFNFSRTIKRKEEEDRWASPRLDTGFLQASEAGEIGGLHHVEQGLGLDVRPYVSGKASNRRAIGTDSDGKGGADVFYSLTPSLKLTSTFNTDFAETENDDRQINITRDPLYFPEKRAFFLENAGIFNFATFKSSRPDIVPFFSRRIGLLAGEEVPILLGTKLTGKAGRYDVGTIYIHTRDAGTVDARDLFVTRLKRGIFRQSSVGVIYTEGAQEVASTSRTYGVDLNLETSRFQRGDKNFAVNGFALRSRNGRAQHRDAAFGFGVRFPNELWDWRAEWYQVEENFDPALGFLTRPNVRKLQIAAQFRPRPGDFLDVRKLIYEAKYTRFTRLDDHKAESWKFSLAPLFFALNSGDEFEFNYIPTYERFVEPFEIAKGVVLQPGDFHFTRWRLLLESATKRPVSVAGKWLFGDFYSGRGDEVEASVDYRLPPHLQLGLVSDQTFAHLREGDFVTRILAMRANYSVSPQLTFLNLVQYDNASRNLGLQSRARWTVRPGHDMFVVFNRGWIQDDTGGFDFRPAETHLALKFQYTFRF